MIVVVVVSCCFISPAKKLLEDLRRNGWRKVKLRQVHLLVGTVSGFCKVMVRENKFDATITINDNFKSASE